MATAKTKQKILSVFVELLEKHPYEDVSLQLIAETAKVKLSDLRRAYPSKLALVEAFAESIDAAVLDERDEGMDDQPARDRLFDILMTRIDALAEHKEAVRALKAAADDDPGLALELNRIAHTLAEMDACRRGDRSGRSEGHSGRPRARNGVCKGRRYLVGRTG
jgi:AcrR family transcriptional regulator